MDAIRRIARWLQAAVAALLGRVVAVDLAEHGDWATTTAPMAFRDREGER